MLQDVKYSSKEIEELQEEISKTKKGIAEGYQSTFTNVEKMFEYLNSN